MSLNLKDVVDSWKVMVLVSILSIIFGIFIISHPFVATEVLSIICGITLLIAEIINLVESIYISVKMKKLTK